MSTYNKSLKKVTGIKKRGSQTVKELQCADRGQI